MTNQANSFPCKFCGEVYTEESGASEGFTCEKCANLIDPNEIVNVRVIGSMYNNRSVNVFLKDGRMFRVQEEELVNLFALAGSVDWVYRVDQKQKYGYLKLCESVE